MKDNYYSDIKKYGLSEIDEHGTLKYSPLLFVITAYLSRHLLLIAYTGALVLTSLKKQSARSPFDDMIEFSSGPLFVVASIGSMLVLIAAVKRQPDSGKFLRWIWERGKWLLISSALLDIVFLGLQTAKEPDGANLVVGLTFLLDVYVVFYLLKSARVKDTFACFCGELAKPEKRV